jgi:hypothetical protein
VVFSDTKTVVSAPVLLRLGFDVLVLVLLVHGAGCPVEKGKGRIIEDWRCRKGAISAANSPDLLEPMPVVARCRLSNQRR